MRELTGFTALYYTRPPLVASLFRSFLFVVSWL